MNQLEKDPFGPEDLTGEPTIASYSPGGVPESMLVCIRWMAEDTTNVGATYTIRVKLANDEDGEAYTVFDEQYVHAEVAGNIGGVTPVIPLKPDETLDVTLHSTDAGDNAIDGAVWFMDAATTQSSVQGLVDTRTTVDNSLTAYAPATSVEVAALVVHGDATWTTAAGFAVAGDAMNLVNGAIVAATFTAGAITLIQANLATSVELAALQAHGDVAWISATGIDIDSTGTEVVLLGKACEIVLAYAMGAAQFDPATNRWTLYGRDGITAIARVQQDGLGNRSESEVV